MTTSDTDSSMVWNGALTCPCGRPYILLKINEVLITKSRELQPLATYVRCPVHRRVRRIFLPYSRLSEWIGPVSDRLFRCNTCGSPSQLQKIAIKGHFTAVLLNCPKHGTNDNKRLLWSPIFTAAKGIKEIQLAEKLPISDIFEEDVERICPHCGTENDSDAMYCAFCGHLL